MKSPPKSSCYRSYPLDRRPPSSLREHSMPDTYQQAECSTQSSNTCVLHLRLPSLWFSFCYSCFWSQVPAFVPSLLDCSRCIVCALSGLSEQDRQLHDDLHPSSSVSWSNPLQCHGCLIECFFSRMRTHFVAGIQCSAHVASSRQHVRDLEKTQGSASLSRRRKTYRLHMEPL